MEQIERRANGFRETKRKEGETPCIEQKIRERAEGKQSVGGGEQSTPCAGGRAGGLAGRGKWSSGFILTDRPVQKLTDPARKMDQLTKISRSQEGRLGYDLRLLPGRVSLQPRLD